MAKTYQSQQGDTYSRIARRFYGTDARADLIRRSNPGTFEPLEAGITITIPDMPGAPKNQQSGAQSTNPDEVSILIEGERFRFWHNATFTDSMDTVNTVEFDAPFEPDDQAFRERFEPFTYKDVVVNIGGAPVFTGTQIAVRPESSATSRTVVSSSYSKPGVLMDCTPPASSFPLEFNDLTLKEIMQELIAPFGLGLVYNAPAGDRFDRVAIQAGSTVWQFLSDLSKQRKVILTNDDAGNVLATQAVEPGNPVGFFSEGDAGPITSVDPYFNEQDYYSDITGIQPVMIGSEGSQHTVRNSRLTGVTRPFTFTGRDTNEGTLPEAVEAKVARMFGNMVSYRVNVSTWRAPNGERWKSNTSLKLLWPSAMIYQQTEFIIRDVAFSAQSDNRTATLTVVLPGAFTGGVPGVLPWGS